MRVGGVVLCLFLLGAAPLYAQGTPRFELSGGYSFMRDADRAEDFPTGWFASTMGSINDWAGIAVEIGGNNRLCSKCQRGPFASQTFLGTDLHLKVYTYMAGPRFASHAISAVTPFAQFLFGGSHASGGIEFDGALNSGLTYQPGAGIEINVTPKVGVQFEGDYRIIRTKGRDNKESRLLAGVVIRTGQR